MGVYIKNMKMPKDCEKCIFYLERYDEDGDYLSPICVPTQLLSEAGCGLNRASYCPLIEVAEPHGRLIDADVLANIVSNTNIQAGIKEFIEDMIGIAPTVIEAEEG